MLDVTEPKAVVLRSTERRRKQQISYSSSWMIAKNASTQGSRLLAMILADGSPALCIPCSCSWAVLVPLASFRNEEKVSLRLSIDIAGSVTFGSDRDRDQGRRDAADGED